MQGSLKYIQPNAEAMLIRDYCFISPITGEPATEVCCHTKQMVLETVSKARLAAGTWAKLPIHSRIACVERINASLVEAQDRMAQALRDESGRPLQECIGADILPTVSALKYNCAHAAKWLKVKRGIASGVRTVPNPYGVVSIIGTWNYPLFLNLVSICQALLAGNTVVWKPSELAPLSAHVLEQVLLRADLPENVVNFVYGDADTGRYLVQADCDLYVFTGGVKTGRAILADLAPLGRPAIMELSGNDAFLVCADAPLELAAKSAVWARITNAGQSCISPQRIYVDRRVLQDFVGLMEAAIDSLTTDELTPMRTLAARDRCDTLVQDALRTGARKNRGACPDSSRSGFYYRPTLLTECTDEMAIMSEDVFGPVIAVSSVESMEEAVRRTNANPLGLSASVWTCDKRLGQTLAANLRVGLVSINEALIDAARPDIAFGGMQSSGFGKLRGEAGLESMVVRKTIVQHSHRPTRRHLYPYIQATSDILRSCVNQTHKPSFANVAGLMKACGAWYHENQARSQEGNGNT